MTEETGGQLSFFDLDTQYTKTSLGPYHQTKEKIGGASLKQSSALPNRMPMCLDLRNRGLMQVQLWEMDGLSLGAYTMHSFGESPKDAVESHLSQILQGGVPRKYYLSAMACKGILRRAAERGKELPELLRMVLERQSHSKTDADVRGGKGVLVQRDRTGALSTVNNQAVITEGLRDIPVRKQRDEE